MFQIQPHIYHFLCSLLLPYYKINFASGINFLQPAFFFFFSSSYIVDHLVTYILSFKEYLTMFLFCTYMHMYIYTYMYIHTHISVYICFCVYISIYKFLQIQSKMIVFSKDYRAVIIFWPPLFLIKNCMYFPTLAAFKI